MIVVGVDLSLASTGICRTNGPAVWVNRIQSKGTKTDTVDQRVHRLRDITRRILQHLTDADLMVLEAPSLGQSRQAGEHMRAGLWWHLVITAARLGYPIAEVTPATLKQYATGKGSASKDAVLAAAVRRYPNIDITGNDVADATVLAAIGARHLGQPLEESLPQRHLDALDKINWPEGNHNGTRND